MTHEFWVGVRRNSTSGDFEQTRNGTSLVNQKGIDDIWASYDPNEKRTPACGRVKPQEEFQLTDDSCSSHYHIVCQHYPTLN